MEYEPKLSENYNYMSFTFYFNFWEVTSTQLGILASYDKTTSFLSHIVVVLHLRLMYMHQISFFITF